MFGWRGGKKAEAGTGTTDAAAPAGAGARPSAVHRLDTSGEICPYPLVMTKKAMAGLKPGEVLRVSVDYPKSMEDIPRWAAEEGHAVLEVAKTGEAQWEIALRKKGA